MKKIVLRRGLFYEEDNLGHALSRQKVIDLLDAARAEGDRYRKALEGIVRDAREIHDEGETAVMSVPTEEIDKASAALKAPPDA